MTKFLSYLFVFLSVVIFILFNLYTERGNEIEALETKLNAYKGKSTFLEGEIARRNEKALAADKLKQENNKQIDKDKTGFNWNYDLSANPVLLNFKRLHNKN